MTTGRVSLELRAARCSMHSAAGGWRHAAPPPALLVRLCLRDYAVPPCGDASSNILLPRDAQTPPVPSLTVRPDAPDAEYTVRVYFSAASVLASALEVLARDTSFAMRWRDTDASVRVCQPSVPLPVTATRDADFNHPCSIASCKSHFTTRSRALHCATPRVP